MNDEWTPKALQDFIDLLEEYHPQNWIATLSAWTYELQHNPKNFYRNDKGELMWLGYKVVATTTFSNNEACFWLMADKIIPKES